MLAIQDHFSHQLRDHLKTTAMGFGLVRLLQDAGMTEEARTTLYSLENGFQIEVQDEPAVCQSPESFYVATAGSNASVSASTQLDTWDLSARPAGPFDSAFWSGHPSGTISPRR
jgi:hypothetical protein